MGDGKDEIHRWHAEAAWMALGEAWAAAYTEDACQMGQITRTGVWLSLLSSAANGAALG